MSGRRGFGEKRQEERGGGIRGQSEHKDRSGEGSKMFSSDGRGGGGGGGEGGEVERIGINGKKGGAEQQCPGSKQWRQARWLQGTLRPAKCGQQARLWPTFCTKAWMMQEEPYIDSGWQRRLLSL